MSILLYLESVNLLQAKACQTLGHFSEFSRFVREMRRVFRNRSEIGKNSTRPFIKPTSTPEVAFIIRLSGRGLGFNLLRLSSFSSRTQYFLNPVIDAVESSPYFASNSFDRHELSRSGIPFERRALYPVRFE
jgi:hypothetical protein